MAVSPRPSFLAGALLLDTAEVDPPSYEGYGGGSRWPPPAFCEIEGVNNLHCLILGIALVGGSFALGFGRSGDSRRTRRRHLPWQWFSKIIQTARSHWEPVLPEEFEKLDLYVEKFLTELGLRTRLPLARRNNLDYEALLTLDDSEICMLLGFPPDETLRFHELRESLANVRELGRTLGHVDSPATELQGTPNNSPRSSSQRSFASDWYLADAVKAEGASQRRIVSVGDLHGDYASTELILRAMGIMGEHGEWIGGDTIFVQTGDVCDRGDHSGEIYRALFRLQDEAPCQGGQVILLFGNHDILNLAGEFDFAGDDETASLAGMDAAGLSDGEHAARTRVFAPDGWVGRGLRRRGQAAALLGKEAGFQQPLLFVHGGLMHRTVAMLQSLCEVSFEELAAAEILGPTVVDILNSVVHRYLSGTAEEVNSFVNCNEEPCREIFGEFGPFWCRELAMGDAGPTELQATLDVLGAIRMVVGHTPQRNGEVRHWYGGRLVLTDTLISAAYTGTPHLSALEITADGAATAVYPTRKLRVRLPTPPGGNQRAASLTTTASNDDSTIGSPPSDVAGTPSPAASVSVPVVVACEA